MRLAVLVFLLLVMPFASFAKDHGPKRTVPVDLLVLHSIGGPVCKDGKPFFQPIGKDAAFWAKQIAADKVTGIHYVVDRAGATVALIPEDEVANHALGNNPTSIGIELVNTGDGIDPYPEAQLAALIKLVKDIRGRYQLADDQIKTHQQVDGGKMLACGIARRVDPGPALDLQQVILQSRP